ncbi:membrane protein, partial [Candidatus Magnetobacterium bavaricum]
GIIGGILFVLQNYLAFKKGVMLARKEKEIFFKYLIISLSFTTIAVFISTAHYFSPIVPGIQCYYYAILGIIASYPKLMQKEEINSL